MTLTSQRLNATSSSKSATSCLTNAVGTVDGSEGAFIDEDKSAGCGIAMEDLEGVSKTALVEYGEIESAVEGNEGVSKTAPIDEGVMESAVGAIIIEGASKSALVEDGVMESAMEGVGACKTAGCEDGDMDSAKGDACNAAVVEDSVIESAADGIEDEIAVEDVVEGGGGDPASLKMEAISGSQSSSFSVLIWVSPTS